MSKKSRKKGKRKPTRPPAMRLLAALEEVEDLEENNRWEEAAERLERLDRQHPRRPEILGELVNVYQQLGDVAGCQYACERLIPLVPEDPILTTILGGCYLANGRPALALRTFRHFLTRWPEHEEAETARTMLGPLESGLDEESAGLGLSGEQGLQIAYLHDEILNLMERGRFAELCQAAERLLQRKPDFIPAMNNLGEAQFRLGQTEAAIATARRALQLAPDNYHALANLTRYLVLCGQQEEAAPWAVRLKAVESVRSDVWVKKAEALSCIGDDQGILDAFEAAKAQQGIESCDHAALLLHLAAVASLRLGREAEARTLWKQAIRRDDSLKVASENLKDLGRPIGERNGPWAYGLGHWLPAETIGTLGTTITRAARQGNAAVGDAAAQWVRKHPEVLPLVPMLLDRGDPLGREMAVQLALAAKTPALTDALRDFALGQRGSDALRQNAAQSLCEAGLLPHQPIRLWIKGAWHEIVLLGFEIHRECTKPHKEPVNRWAYEAMEAVRQRDGRRAELLLERALQVEPDAPDLLNNLATAYEVQGRQEEADRLYEENLRRHPDYLFARVHAAVAHTRVGNLQEARQILQALLTRKRYHVTEFAAVCQGQAMLLLAEGQLSGARHWVDMWAEVDGDNPEIPSWRRRVSGGLLGCVARALGR